MKKWIHRYSEYSSIKSSSSDPEYSNIYPRQGLKKRVHEYSSILSLQVVIPSIQTSLQDKDWRNEFTSIKFSSSDSDYSNVSPRQGLKKQVHQY